MEAFRRSSRLTRSPSGMPQSALLAEKFLGASRQMIFSLSRAAALNLMPQISCLREDALWKTLLSRLLY